MTVTTPREPQATRPVEPKCPKCGDRVLVHPPTGDMACRDPECAYILPPPCPTPYPGVPILTGIEEPTPGLAERLQEMFDTGGDVDVCPACHGRYVFVHPKSGTYVCGNDECGYFFRNTIVQWTKSTPCLDRPIAEQDPKP